MEDYPRANRIAPRKLFNREDTEFTPWLEENIDFLNDELDISLTITEREQSTPTGFSIDLAVTNEDDGSEGVIECQIEESDHDHLGKLLTYATAFESGFAIWIVQTARYEHRRAIEWLNESSEKSFYLVKIEGIAINDEEAPLFTSIVEPSPTAKEIGERKREPNERELKQEQFWTELLEKSKGRFDLFSNISPKQQGWISKSSGESRVYYRYRLRNDWTDVGLYIDTKSKARNEEIVAELQEHSGEIEETFGAEIDWQPLQDSDASRITYQVTEKGLNDKDDWDEIQETMITHMERFYKAFDEPISNL